MGRTWRRRRRMRADNYASFYTHTHTPPTQTPTLGCGCHKDWSEH